MSRTLESFCFQNPADCELELQTTTPKPIDKGMSDSETDATFSSGATPPPVAAVANESEGTGEDAAAVPGDPTPAHAHALQILMLVHVRLRDGMAECVVKTINVQKQDQDIILRLHGIENARVAWVVLLFNSLKNLFFMRRYTVWTAEVSLANAALDADVEDQEHGRYLVAIHRSSHQPQLTSALHHKGRLGNTNYVRERLQGIMVTSNLPWSQVERRGALYLKAESSRARALIWFILAMAASAGVGLATGLCTKSVGTGLAVGAIAIALLLGLQAILYDKVN